MGEEEEDRGGLAEYASPPCFMHELTEDYRVPAAADAQAAEQLPRPVRAAAFAGAGLAPGGLHPFGGPVRAVTEAGAPRSGGGRGGGNRGRAAGAGFWLPGTACAVAGAGAGLGVRPSPAAARRAVSVSVKFKKSFLAYAR